MSIDVLDYIDRSREKITEFMMEMLRIKAVNPDFGGKGEYARALFVQEQLQNSGLSVTRHEIADSRVPEGVHVNLTSLLEGLDNSRTLWFAAHLDTVPEGTPALWATDPYEPVAKDGRIFGRGSEDNGQAIASTLFALRALKAHKVKPRWNIGVAYVSDEESSSKFGVIPLIEKGIFKPNDMAIVPDGGSPDGSLIEVAEKHMLWLKLTVKGRQVHASTPEKGLNAHRVGLRLVLEIDRYLHAKYADSDSLFHPPISTFEPTKSEANVDNINTIPGVDVQYFDCRVLPRYSLKQVIEDIEGIKLKFEKETEAQIEIVPVEFEENSAQTPLDSEVFRKLKAALKYLRNIDASPFGMGGGTVGSYFRRVGIDTVIWSTVNHMGHQPNEYCEVNNIINDAKVIAQVTTTN